MYVNRRAVVSHVCALRRPPPAAGDPEHPLPAWPVRALCDEMSGDLATPEELLGVRAGGLGKWLGSRCGGGAGLAPLRACRAASALLVCSTCPFSLPPAPPPPSLPLPLNKALGAAVAIIYNATEAKQCYSRQEVAEGGLQTGSSYTFQVCSEWVSRDGGGKMLRLLRGSVWGPCGPSASRAGRGKVGGPFARLTSQPPACPQVPNESYFPSDAESMFWDDGRADVDPAAVAAGCRAYLRPPEDAPAPDFTLVPTVYGVDPSASSNIIFFNGLLDPWSSGEACGPAGLQDRLPCSLALRLWAAPPGAPTQLSTPHRLPAPQAASWPMYLTAWWLWWIRRAATTPISTPPARRIQTRWSRRAAPRRRCCGGGWTRTNRPVASSLPLIVF